LFALRDPNESWSVRTSRRARRLSVRVYPGGRVEIVAPVTASASVVQRFIGQHRQWIDERVRDFATLTNVETELPTTIDLVALDSRYAVEYVARSGAPRVQVQAPGQLLVSGSIANRHAVARALRNWLTDVAIECFGRQLRATADEFGFDYTRCQVRRQRTRWGSCSLSGTISLNVCLLFLDAAIVRYLMIHELCHTRHMNHSSRFWSLVATCEASYRSLDRALTRSWQQVPWWLFG
jgi:predicted metal-dependent hydrolase